MWIWQNKEHYERPLLYGKPTGTNGICLDAWPAPALQGQAGAESPSHSHHPMRLPSEENQWPGFRTVYNNKFPSKYILGILDWSAAARIRSKALSGVMFDIKEFEKQQH